MKKIISLILCAGFCLQLTACSSDALDALGGRKNAWVEEGAALLGDDIRSGEFILNGEKYTFPMRMSDWLDKGWHVSNNYENKDNFTLDIGGMSTEFELFNEDGDYVRVSAYNDTDKRATVDKCMVSSLYISLTDFEAVFPGGIYTENKPAQIMEAYGEPDYKDDGESQAIKAYYDFTSADGWACEAELRMFNNDYTIDAFTAIEYSLIGDEAWNSFMKNSSGEEGCKRFVEAAMQASFHGDFDEYVQYFETRENAEALYDAECSYYASCIMYYAGVDESAIDEAMAAQFKEIAKQVLKKTKWEVVSVKLGEAKTAGTIGFLTLELYPTDFLDIVVDDINAITAESDQEYAEAVLGIYQAKADEAQPAEAISKTYSVSYNEGILDDNQWMEIDDIIMGIAQ